MDGIYTQYPYNDYRLYLMHYAKGQTAKNHKYLYIDENGNYIYSVKQKLHTPWKDGLKFKGDGTDDMVSRKDTNRSHREIQAKHWGRMEQKNRDLTEAEEPNAKKRERLNKIRKHKADRYKAKLALKEAIDTRKKRRKMIDDMRKYDRM